jgi:multidrug efflux pump subunit AcrB
MTNKSIMSVPSIWMIDNPIASSLLTFALIILGLMSFNSINQESRGDIKGSVQHDPQS